MHKWLEYIANKPITTNGNYISTPTHKAITPNRVAAESGFSIDERRNDAQQRCSPTELLYSFATQFYPQIKLVGLLNTGNSNNFVYSKHWL